MRQPLDESFHMNPLNQLARVRCSTLLHSMCIALRRFHRIVVVRCIGIQFYRVILSSRKFRERRGAKSKNKHHHSNSVQWILKSLESFECRCRHHRNNTKAKRPTHTLISALTHTHTHTRIVSTREWETAVYTHLYSTLTAFDSRIHTKGIWKFFVDFFSFFRFVLRSLWAKACMRVCGYM